MADATMRALGLTSILLILLWPVPQELEAQSLAEVARRERGRRALLPDAAVTYTNEAVRRYLSRSAASSSGQPESGAPPGQSSLAEDNPVPTQEEHRWSQRFIRLKATVAAAEERHKTLQSRANALNLKLQGDPFHQTTVADPAHVYGPLIAQTKRQIQQNQQILSRARQELADLREGLRKSGMPLSWGGFAGCSPPPTLPGDRRAAGGDNGQGPSLLAAATEPRRSALPLPDRPAGNRALPARASAHPP